MTINDVLTQMGLVVDCILSMFGDLITVINNNMLIFVPVMFAFLMGIISLAIIIVRKFGVRGRSAAGRRRRR